MNRFRKHRWPAWVFVLAVIANAAIGGIHAVPFLSASALAGERLAGQEVIVCTADGLKRVAIGADGRPVDGDGRNVPASACPICQTLNGLTALVPPNALLTPAPGFADAPVPARQSVACRHFRPRYAGGRSPPLFG